MLPASKRRKIEIDIQNEKQSQTHNKGVIANAPIPIEERIDAKLKFKRELFRDIVDDVSLDLSTALTEEELFGLFGLQPPRKQESQTPGGITFSGMSGTEFEDWLANRLKETGFEVELTPVSRDGGIDMIASRTDELQIESRLLIQCKNYHGPVGVAVVRELRGVVPDRTPGTTPVIACPSGFSADAIAFAKSNGVLLWDAEHLRQLESQPNKGE